MMKLGRYKREVSAALAYVVLLLAVGAAAPSFFGAGNLRDLALNNAPVLLVAVGMTLVILVGEIDISVGSQFAVCSVAAGRLAKEGVPVALLLPSVLLLGALMGALNGALVGYLRLPSIIVTLAMLGVLAAFSWMLRNLGAGRAVYATGSDAEAARLAGIEPRRVVFGVFVLMGALTGSAALLNAVRFSAVPSNAGIGLELKAVAAVVVGGAGISGGGGRLGGA